MTAHVNVNGNNEKNAANLRMKRTGQVKHLLAPALFHVSSPRG